MLCLAGLWLLSAQNKNTTRINPQWCLSYRLAALCDRAQYFIALQPVRHAKRAHLLQSPVDANLTFPQGPSARSAQLARGEHSPLMNLVYRSRRRMEVPQFRFKRCVFSMRRWAELATTWLAMRISKRSDNCGDKDSFLCWR